MHRTSAIQVKEMVLAPPLAATMQNVTGQLAPTSRKTYTIDAKHFAQRPLHLNQVERIVKQRAQAVGIAMSPHGMRASFITLAFEGGADLALVQDGARHKDPRTTRRYQKRRNNLHKNAVDFVWIE
jgi:integrase